jgi:hypothetical protein
MSEQKVTDETLTRLQEINAEFHRLTKYSGELHYQKRILEREILAVDAALDDNSDERLAISKEVQEQFGGAGTVDLTTGVFTKD